MLTHQTCRAICIATSMLLLLLVSPFVAASPLLERLTGRYASQSLAYPENGVAPVLADILPAGTRLLRDVPYGSDDLQRMDVYIPSGAKNAPVIVMAHGGAWRIGDKGNPWIVDSKVMRWLPKGFGFISINYRLWPQTGPIEQARDVAQAIALAQDKAAAWGLDRSKFILMGHSAGAHLMRLVTTDPKLSPGIVKIPCLGTVSLDNAALNVVDTMRQRHFILFDDAFGNDPAYWQAASPYHALSKHARPLLAICTPQLAQPCPQARQYAAKSTSLGVRAVVLEKNMSHFEVNSTLGVDQDYTAEIEAFMADLDPVVASLLKSRPGVH